MEVMIGKSNRDAATNYLLGHNLPSLSPQIVETGRPLYTVDASAGEVSDSQWHVEFGVYRPVPQGGYLVLVYSGSGSTSVLLAATTLNIAN
jgi:hypothetical protein